MSQVELAFLIRPVAGDVAPGVPRPTEHRWPIACSASATRSAIAAIVAS
jgi:hypothetical protein